jgi:hypothetical protein
MTAKIYVMHSLIYMKVSSSSPENFAILKLATWDLGYNFEKKVWVSHNQHHGQCKT